MSICRRRLSRPGQAKLVKSTELGGSWGTDCRLASLYAGCPPRATSRPLNILSRRPPRTLAGRSTDAKSCAITPLRSCAVMIPVRASQHLAAQKTQWTAFSPSGGHRHMCHIVRNHPIEILPKHGPCKSIVAVTCTQAASQEQPAQSQPTPFLEPPRKQHRCYIMRSHSSKILRHHSAGNSITSAACMQGAGSPRATSRPLNRLSRRPSRTLACSSIDARSCVIALTDPAT